MKILTRAVMTLVCVFVVAGSVSAAPLTLRLVPTSPLFNQDPPGAPLPLGRTQYDSGNILLNNQKIGEYVRVKDAHSGSLNVAAVTVTLFFPGATDVPSVITLAGVHSFNSGGGKGSISASDLTGVVGIKFTYDTASGTLTLLFP